MKQTIPDYNPHHCTGCRRKCRECSDRYMFYYDKIEPTRKKHFFFFKGKDIVTHHEGFALYSVDNYLDVYNHQMRTAFEEMMTK